MNSRPPRTAILRPDSITRRTALLGGAAALATGSLPRGAHATQPFRLVVTTTETPLLPNSVMELCASLGYYRREGVAVEIVRVQQTPSAVAALLSGQGEMANLSVESTLLLASKKQPLKAVLSPHKSLPFVIAGRESLESVRDLASKTFGVGRLGSLDHTLTAAVLNKLGVDEASLRFVAMGQPSTRAQALAAGRIDAATVSLGVWLGIAKSGGLKLLVSEPDFFAAAPVVNKVNVVGDETLRTRRGEVVAVTRAILRASRDFARDPGLWADAMTRERPDVPRADLDRLAAGFARSWSVNGGLNRSELAFAADWNARAEEFREVRMPQLAEWADFSVLDGVLAEMGVEPGIDPPERA